MTDRIWPTILAFGVVCLALGITFGKQIERRRQPASWMALPEMGDTMVVLIGSGDSVAHVPMRIGNELVGDRGEVGMFSATGTDGSGRRWSLAIRPTR